jgi:hypothetical protein
MTLVAVLLVVNATILLGRLELDGLNRYLDILSALTAVIGIVAIWYQLKKDKELNEAQFIYELNNAFYQNPDIMKVYQACNDYYMKLNETSGLLRSDEKYVTQYFSFFGIINTFVEKGVLNMDLIDRTFSYRYFLVANTPEIQDLFLIQDSAYYKGNYNLYNNWIKYREDRKLDIILLENDLRKRNPDGFVVGERR